MLPGTTIALARACPDLLGIEHPMLVRNGTDEAVLREVWTENVYRLHVRQLVHVLDTETGLQFGGPRGIVVDVGANIGALTVLAALLGVDVLAIEPDPANLALLEEHVVTAAGARDLSRAIGLSEIGTIRLRPVAVGAWRRFSVAWESAGPNSRFGGDGTVRVDVRPLDEIVADAGWADAPIALLKLDVEGAEYEILEFPSETVARAERVVIEWHAVGEYDRFTSAKFGTMLRSLLETHDVEIMGRASTGGGYVYGTRR